MRSRFDASRFDASLVGLQWALRFVILAIAILALAACSANPTSNSGAVASIEVTAQASSLEAGDSVLLTAAPKRANGRVRTDAEVSWLSTDTSVATVEGRAGQNAMVVAKKPGPVTIRAMVESETGQTFLTVAGQNPKELSLVRWTDVEIRRSSLVPLNSAVSSLPRTLRRSERQT